MSASGQDVDLALFEFRPCNHNLKKSIYLSYYFSVLARDETGILRFLVLPSKVATVLDTRRGWRTLLVELKLTWWVGHIIQVVFYRWKNVHRCARMWDELNLLRWTCASTVLIAVQQMLEQLSDMVLISCLKKGKKSWRVAQKHSGESLDRNTPTHTYTHTEKHTTRAYTWINNRI